MTVAARGSDPHAPVHTPERPMAPSSTDARARGSVATELVLLVPLFVVLLLLVGFAGRVAHAQSSVRELASRAARAASLRQSPSSAAADARAVASGTAGCVERVVEVDVSGLRPGGTVAVTVRCRASFHDLGLLGVPGSRWFSARSVQPVDARRGG